MPFAFCGMPVFPLPSAETRRGAWMISSTVALRQPRELNPIQPHSIQPGTENE